MWLFLVFLSGKAQTGIGTTTPHASAKLDVSATNKGFLPPRVTLTAATDATTIASPAEGLLVYNLGSVGLQAGYYYWNGTSWATIATGTTAGNAVVSSDLVKLYSEAYSNAIGKISNTSGYSFTVPISGRYLFDFSSTTWGGISTTTFKVRLGTTDLGTDSQTSFNNNVHVEYNGKIEVNLQAGITFNVALTTNANRDSNDYDRVYYKMIAGNLPVNQHMAERNIQLNNNFLSNDGGNEGISIDNSGNVNVTGKINVGDPTGNVVTKASGLVNRGVDVTLGNLKARIATSGNASLQLSTVSGTYSVYGSNVYTAGGVAGITIADNGPRTISITPVYLSAGLNFTIGGYTDTWIIMDTSNTIAWRITMILGSSYNNNFISIERLL